MLTTTDAAVIKGMLNRGDLQHHIAAFFKINSGRVAEIKTGEKFAEVEAVSLDSLPPVKGRWIDPKAPLAKQQEMFKLLLNNPPENSRIVTITPELAEWILEVYNNGGNRKVKPARIKRYAEAIKNDGWVLTGEPLIFGSVLLDGQNRLKGCVVAQKNFRTYIQFGIDDDVFTTINSGVSRSPTDTFYTAGIPNHQIIAPAVRWLMLYASGNPQSRASYSNQEMWDYYQNHVDTDSMDLAVARAKTANKAIPRGALAAHFYLFDEKNHAMARKLASDFQKNQLGARKLTTALVKARKENFGRLNDIAINALLVQTWNAYRAGRNVRAPDLTYNNTREYPAIA